MLFNLIQSGTHDPTRYGLDGPRPQSREGVGGEGGEVSAHVQTGPEAYSASCTMRTGSLSHG